MQAWNCDLMQSWCPKQEEDLCMWTVCHSPLSEISSSSPTCGSPPASTFPLLGIQFHVEILQQEQWDLDLVLGSQDPRPPSAETEAKERQVSSGFPSSSSDLTVSWEFRSHARPLAAPQHYPLAGFALSLRAGKSLVGSRPSCLPLTR